MFTVIFRQTALFLFPCLNLPFQAIYFIPGGLGLLYPSPRRRRMQSGQESGGVPRNTRKSPWPGGLQGVEIFYLASKTANVADFLSIKRDAI
jgi:hypothetical protein